MDGLWDPPFYQATEDTMSFCLPYDVIEETSLNEKCCIQVLEILISKADTDIVEHEDELMDLLSQLACTDQVLSDMFSMSLRTKIDFLESSIQKLKDDDENFLSTKMEPAESIYDILNSLYCGYIQKKDLQFADNTGTPSNSCQDPTVTQKKQIGSSSNVNQEVKIEAVNIILVEKLTVTPTIVKIEEDTNYHHAIPVPKYPLQSLCWGSTKKTNRQVNKFMTKSPITMKKDIVQNITPRCNNNNSIYSKPSLETLRKRKHPLNIVKSQFQKYDESMSLATVPYIQPSEESNTMSLVTVPFVESFEETNETQIYTNELDFPPGYSEPQHSRSTRTYARRKKPDSPLQTVSNPPCLTLVVAKPLDRDETYDNPFDEEYYTVSDLRFMAKHRKIKHYYKLRKAELAHALGIKLNEGRKQQRRSETQLVSMIKCEPQRSLL